MERIRGEGRKREEREMERTEEGSTKKTRKEGRGETCHLVRVTPINVAV